MSEHRNFKSLIVLLFRFLCFYRRTRFCTFCFYLTCFWVLIFSVVGIGPTWHTPNLSEPKHLISVNKFNFFQKDAWSKKIKILSKSEIFSKKKKSLKKILFFRFGQASWGVPDPLAATLSKMFLHLSKT